MIDRLARVSMALYRLFREYDDSNLRHDAAYEPVADALDNLRVEIHALEISEERSLAGLSEEPT